MKDEIEPTNEKGSEAASDNETIRESVQKNEAPNLDGTEKKGRKRLRHYYNAIREQMEFYFGDANLSKDRFLKQLTEKDPFVPLEVFLTFNKMKKLTDSVESIAKSLSKSQLLELDESGQKVRRKKPLPVDRNVDDSTLYVESLPPTADHDWVRQMFDQFGPIAYVSLPKYSKSGKIKEFGFVEFEKKSSVEKAVKAFKEFHGVLNMLETDPAELLSVKTYNKEKEAEEIKKSGGDSKKSKRRRKHTSSENTEETAAEPYAKKAKNDDADDLDESAQKTQSEEKNNSEKEAEDNTVAGDAKKAAKKRREETTNESAGEESEPQANKSKAEDKGAAENKTSTETGTEVESASDTNNEGAEEKEDSADKKKHRKKKKKSVEARRKEAELKLDAAYYELKILPKRDWKRLRNKYLNLQREKIAELKRKAGKEQKEQPKVTTKAADATTTPDAKKAKPNERKLQKINMNFYGAGEDEPLVKTTTTRDAEQHSALERAPLFSYEPGLIVELNFLEPCVNVKEFKADMRQYASVKYVDVKEGVMHAHLRHDSPTSALDFVRQVSCAEYKCKVLTGEAENEYWRKIEEDRKMKLLKQVKVPQKRGREKIKKLVTKHIRFGDDDEE